MNQDPGSPCGAHASGSSPCAQQPLTVTTTTDAGDLGLVSAAVGGDPGAAEAVIKRVGSSILAAVRKVFGAEHPDFDDVTQEATIALLRALPHYRHEARIETFAYRVALLLALSRWRRNQSRGRSELDRAVCIDGVPTLDPHSPYLDALRRERRQLVRRLLAELSEPIAEAVALHYMVGHTVEDIAALSSVSPHTVWSRLRLGKRTLRRRIERNAALSEAAHLDTPEP